jgi:hypothetical protein
MPQRYEWSTCHECVESFYVLNLTLAVKSLFDCRHEYMGDLGGKSFFQANKDWDTQPIMGLLNKHGKEMYGE